MKNLLRLFETLACAVVCFLCSCTSQLATSGPSGTRFTQAPKDRPGLGTKWGEPRRSNVDITDFQRADPEHPVAVAGIYYNDEAGVRAMAGAVTWQRNWSTLPSPTEGLVSVGLKDPIGFFYQV
jgi:hypothetical protein